MSEMESGQSQMRVSTKGGQKRKKKSVINFIKSIAKSKEEFERFAAHLINCFCVESLLFLLEVIEFKKQFTTELATSPSSLKEDELTPKESGKESSKNEKVTQLSSPSLSNINVGKPTTISQFLTNVKLPEGLPKSKILSETKSKEKQCILLFEKYISPGVAPMEINVSFESRNEVIANCQAVAKSTSIHLKEGHVFGSSVFIPIGPPKGHNLGSNAGEEQIAAEIAMGASKSSGKGTDETVSSTKSPEIIIPGDGSMVMEKLDEIFDPCVREIYSLLTNAHAIYAAKNGEENDKKCLFFHDLLGF